MTRVITPTAAHLAGALPPILAARPRTDLAGTGTPAGVLIVLFDRDDAAHLVLTKRTDYAGHHSGEISLPGGRHEPGDADLRATALRETHEELGLPPQTLVVLGPLDDVQTLVSGFTVQPWVAHHPGGRPALTPHPDEVARVIEVPLADLLTADQLLPHDPPFDMLRYRLRGEDVWGMTARILRTFTEIVRHAMAVRA